MIDRWKTFLGTLGVLVLVLVGAPASAQTADPQCPPDSDGYVPAECQLRASESQVDPGEDITVSGDGYGPNVPIRIELRSDPVTIGNTTTNAAGAFSTRVVIPAGTTAGRHTIAAIGNNPAGLPRELSFSVVVSGDTAASGLPRTGSSTLPFVAAGVGLIGLGVIALRGARRRTAHSTPS